MLRKLLKYDLRSVFRFWWIAVIISVFISLVGGIFSLVDQYQGWLPDLISSMTQWAIFFSYCSYFALMVLTLVLLFIRFFKNFFTDEGYLTFTLPVSRKELLNSKVIAGFLSMTATAAVCGLDLLLMLSIESSADLKNGSILAPILEYVARGVRTRGVFFWIYLAEGVVLALLVLMLMVLFLYFCITFGSMIVKKGKLIASIAIFYGATSLFITISQVLLIFGSFGFMFGSSADILYRKDPLLALFLLGLIFYLSMLCCFFYAMQYRMLEKKLNLP